MAFFGLTQLGEQDYFRANSHQGLNLALFSENDVVCAVDQTIGQDGSEVPVEKFAKYLEKLYRGPLVPDWDLGMIKDELAQGGFDLAEGSSVPRQQFIEAVLKCRATTMDPSFWQQTKYLPAEYESHSEYQRASKAHERLKYNPREKFMNPVASSQEYGWMVGQSDFEILDNKCSKHYPKTASEETAFADAMAQAGLH